MRNIPDYDLDASAWYKSSYSDGSGGNCLEATHDFQPLIPVRDSKTPQGPKLFFSSAAWVSFTSSFK